MRSLIAALIAGVLLGATPFQLDSQVVLQRYELEMGDLVSPKTMIFDYSVSQLGNSDIEQRHTIYRSGLKVRDETLSIDGIALKPKIVTFGRRVDRYALGRVAPRVADYSMLFTRAVRDGSHVDYAYDTTPLSASASGFEITRVVIDGISYLPREIDFRTAAGDVRAIGKLVYGKSDKYWMPMIASVEATVAGKPARERIVWSGYRFPKTLPPSTFVPPRPLPHATLPPI